MSKGRGGSRIGQIIRRNVNGLHRRDRALFRRSNTLLQFAHLGCQVRLVSHGARHTSKKRGHLRTCLSKAEDVVNEEKRIGALLVTEKFGDGKRRQSYSQTRSWGLGHLPVDQRGFRLGGIARRNNAGLAHFEPQVITLAGTLANTPEH